nr:uncharacterized protein LOC128682188 [Plodia interpunctella]
MSIWTFSSSSEEKAERCIAAAQPPDETNKWIQRFGLKNCYRPNITSNNLNQNKTIISNVQTIDEDSDVSENDDLNVEHFNELLESIQSEPVSKFPLLVTETLLDHRLLRHLAEKLNSNTAEKIINHIYENKDLNTEFVERIHQYFIPVLLHKEHGWFTLDMVLKSFRIYPKCFDILLKIILKDVQISNQVLQDLFENFNEKETYDVLLILMELELTTQEFLHNILGIYIAYKHCKKTVETQNWVYKQILQHGNGCANDKNYGKLLLAFLQTEKETQTLKNYGSIEKILEVHRSPFKRPCMNLLQELMIKCNSADTTGVFNEIS